MTKITDRRTRILSAIPYTGGHVIYWMSRDQRAHDNWALIHAYRTAMEARASLSVVFTLSPGYPDTSPRTWSFLIKGLEETYTALQKLQIPLFILTGHPPAVLSEFAIKISAGAVVCDFDPLRIKRLWKHEFMSTWKGPFIEADAHNIIPAWALSDKMEYGAYTLRPKIRRLLPGWLDDFPVLGPYPHNKDHRPLCPDWHKIRLSCGISADNGQGTIEAGSTAGEKALVRFCTDKIKAYDNTRNDPNTDGLSGLSPYFHFGQISPQRAALAVSALPENAGTLAFLEQLIVRRELSDNHCLYNPDYDNWNGLPEWARKSLLSHADDPRENIYSLDVLENAATGDPLWNAAQKQLVLTGNMHGYLRMYWAKRLLAWTGHPEQALSWANTLNDRYSLDGRDPNGYTGTAWAIGGRHDRPWPQRPVYGNVRVMTPGGMKRKWNVMKFIKRFEDIRL